MNECRMVEFCPCKIIGIIISAILGIAAGALFFNGIITVVPFVLWFLIIFSAIAIILLVVATLVFLNGMCEDIIRCFCRSLGLLIAGSVGTVIAGILIFLFSEFLFLLAFLVGFLVFFFGLLLTGIICYLLCVCESVCDDNTSGAGNNNCCCCCYPCSCENTNSDNSNNSNSCNLRC